MFQCDVHGSLCIIGALIEPYFNVCMMPFKYFIKPPKLVCLRGEASPNSPLTSEVVFVMRAVRKPMTMPTESPPRATVKKEATPREISTAPTVPPVDWISANVFIMVYSTTATPSNSRIKLLQLLYVYYNINKPRRVFSPRQFLQYH